MIRIIERTAKSDTLDKFGKIYGVPREETWTIKLPFGWRIVKEEKDSDYKNRIMTKIKTKKTKFLLDPGVIAAHSHKMYYSEFTTHTELLERLGNELGIKRKCRTVNLPRKIKLMKEERNKVYGRRLHKALEEKSRTY